MLVELAMLTFVATSTAQVATSPPMTAPIEQSSALVDETANPVLLAASGGSGSRGGRSSSKGSSNRGAGGYQQSGQGGYQQTGQGGYVGGGRGSKDMDITPPNATGGGVRTSPPISPPWSPQWSPPGN
jgi:hypothetical protein